MDKKICPFMTQAFQYATHSTDHGQVQYCIEEKCMAWGISLAMEKYVCKLIDKERK
jgi:hypothetical protein